MAQIEFIARAVIRKEDELLLAHKIGETNTFLPGGHIEPGEYAEEALRRELLEELGIVPVIGEFVGVVEHKFTDRHGERHEEVNLIFEAQVGEGEVSSREGHLEFKWAKYLSLLEENLLPSCLPGLLRKWLMGGEPFHYAQRA